MKGLKILIIGKGAGDHALARAIAKNPLVDRLYVIPGNAGLRKEAAPNHFLTTTSLSEIVNFIKVEHIDYTIVNDIEALQAGLVDLLNKEGLPSFGPSKKAAGLHKNIALVKDIMPDLPIYKGDKNYRPEKEVLISLFTDSSNVCPLPGLFCINKIPDYDGDTEGLAALLPHPVLKEEEISLAKAEIVLPFIKALAKADFFFEGILSFRIYMTEKGPALRDIYANMDDLAACLLYTELESDALDLFTAVNKDKLSEIKPAFNESPACGLILLNCDYPHTYESGLDVEVDRKYYKDFYFSDVKQLQGALKTNGGRIAAIVKSASTYKEAYEEALDLTEKIQYESKFYLKDLEEYLK